jgi:hypothetical protein
MSNPRIRKRTKAQREAQLAEIAELDLCGWSQARIAEKFCLTQSQISKDLKEIYRRQAPESASEKTKLRKRIHFKIQYAQKELLAAWHAKKSNPRRKPQSKPSGMKETGSKRKKGTAKEAQRA